MSSATPPDGSAPGHGQQQPYTGQPHPGQQPYAGQPQYGAQPPYGGQQPYPGQPYAGAGAGDPTDVVGARVGQYLLDGLVLGVPLAILFSVVPSIFVAGASTVEEVQSALGVLAVLYPILFLIAIAGGWFIMAYVPSRRRGQTLAMGWLKLRIVNEDGVGEPTLGQLSTRWILLIVDGLFVGLVGFLIMNSSPLHQRLGDKVAHTLVVRA